jgi:hypothetical protein
MIIMYIDLNVSHHGRTQNPRKDLCAFSFASMLMMASGDALVRPESKPCGPAELEGKIEPESLVESEELVDWMCRSRFPQLQARRASSEATSCHLEQPKQVVPKPRVAQGRSRNPSKFLRSLNLMIA